MFDTLSVRNIFGIRNIGYSFVSSVFSVTKVHTKERLI